MPKDFWLSSFGEWGDRIVATSSDGELVVLDGDNGTVVKKDNWMRQNGGQPSQAYYCYVDKHGKAHKPFCLPQKNPTFYDDFLKSFNAPEMAKGRIPFNAVDVANAMKLPAEKFE